MIDCRQAFEWIHEDRKETQTARRKESETRTGLTPEWGYESEAPQEAG